MSLLKPSSPMRIAANQGSRAGVRGSGFEKKEGTGLAEEGRRQGSGLRDSRRVTINLRGQSIDSTFVVSQVVQPKKPRRAELKGLIELTGHVFRERWTTFSGFAGPPKRGDADLLIQKGLLARWRRTGGEPLLNLKDLLAVLPPSLKRVLETGPILTPLFLCRIAPNSAIFCQNVAEYGIKSTFFATDFVRTGQVLRLQSHSTIPTGAEHKLALRPKASPERPTRICRQAVTGFHQRGRWLVTDMVKLRKLSRGVSRHFPHPFWHFGENLLLKTNMLSEQVSAFGRFWGYQIVPNSTNFYQFLPKTCSEGARTGT